MEKQQKSKNIVFVCIILILCILNVFIHEILLKYLLFLCSGILMGYLLGDNKKKNIQSNLKIGNVLLTGERYKIIMEVIQILAIEEAKSKQTTIKK